MAISEDSILKAKQKSIEFLEVSIATTAMALGVPLSDLSSDWDIPVSESDPSYKSYKSLKDMYTNLLKLTV